MRFETGRTILCTLEEQDFPKMKPQPPLNQAGLVKETRWHIRCCFWNDEMKIHLIPVHFDLTDAIASFTSLKINHLDVITDSICGAAVILAQEHSAEPAKRFTAKVHLAMPGKDLHAEESSSDIYAAIDGVQSKLARQLRKRKTRLTDGSVRRFQRSRERARYLGIAA